MTINDAYFFLLFHQYLHFLLCMSKFLVFNKFLLLMCRKLSKFFQRRRKEKSLRTTDLSNTLDQGSATYGSPRKIIWPATPS